MKNIIMVLGIALFCVAGLVIAAEEKGKEVTLKGEVMCTKCALSETPDCGHAIKVKENGKEVTYYFKDNGKAESYHDKVCGGPANGTVKGKVEEKDGKKWIIPAKDGVKF